jgi:5'-nucleotidase
MRRTKTKVAAVAVMVVAGAVGGTPAATAAPPSQGAQPLDILLTNDDGWNAPGITAVYDALVADGHHVTLVAPAANQSGAGARHTFSGNSLVLRHEAANKYSVTGAPADATEVGLSLVLADAPPDLVISGTNRGHNITAATIHSGTVGAAATALGDGVPAIAISTEASFTDPSAPIPFSDTAAWLVKLLGALQDRSQGGTILPEGVGLNINYPIVGTGPEFAAPAGVAWTQTGTGFFDLDYADVALPDLGGSIPLEPVLNLSVPETTPNADSTALAHDFISVTPIEGDYDAPAQALGQLRNTVTRVPAA